VEKKRGFGWDVEGKFGEVRKGEMRAEMPTCRSWEGRRRGGGV
jgi:hypothetical protein